MTWVATDLQGQTFGRITVVGRGPNTHDGKARWSCWCECGRVKLIRAAVLRSGSARSCGCLARESTSLRSRTHGMSKSPEWAAWQGMRKRCANSSSEKAKHYRDRGIRVCERWDSFIAFYEDMGPKPTRSHTLDRIDPTGNYEPENCRWATVTIQNRNKRSNRVYEHNGETMTAAEWSRRLSITQSSLMARIRNWGVERALTKPKRNQS